MVENKNSKRFLWILSLLLGPAAFFVLLIASPETPTIDEISQKLSQFVFCFLILWIIGFGLVWGLYRLKRYISIRANTAD
ncbi:MAG: hypothetical protein ACYS3S_03385 [Planctomycetota bacterium]|jgi:hypothetical protein